jgi:GntR family transcriptional repressor for pyruvate dehydrogenase complex
MAEEIVYHPVRPDGGDLPLQAARQVLDLIESRELEVDSQLPSLDELSRHLGVSRASVREAIKLLDAWGVVTVKHGVGTFVAGLRRDTLTIPFKVGAERGNSAVLNLHQIRQALEPDIAALAARNARPEHIEKMGKALVRMEQALDNPRDFILADMTFHSTLAEATGNDLFVLIIHAVIGLLEDSRYLTAQPPTAGKRALPSHRDMLDHVKAGRADQAREAMQSHLDITWHEVLAHYEKEAESETAKE